MCWRVENMWSIRHYQLRSVQTMETQYWMQSALKSLHTGRESPADEWEVTLSRMITGVQWYSYCRISTINRVPNEPSLHPPIDYHWLLLLNVSMIQLVILLIMISSGYYSTILLIIWQLHWLSTHPPTTPLHSSPLVQILKFLTIHWSMTEGVYPCFLFDSVVKNDYQEIVWHVVLC